MPVTVIMLGGYQTSIVRGADGEPMVALSLCLASGHHVEFQFPDGGKATHMGIPNEMLPDLIRALKNGKLACTEVGNN